LEPGGLHVHTADLALAAAAAGVRVTIACTSNDFFSPLLRDSRVRRYERENPGELIHICIKKLGRIDGVGHRITGDRRG
jgi:hypothetical protein